MKRAIISFLIIFLTGGILYGADNSPVAPTVSIISPVNGTATNQNSVDVTVSFKASAYGKTSAHK